MSKQTRCHVCFARQQYKVRVKYLGAGFDLAHGGEAILDYGVVDGALVHVVARAHLFVAKPFFFKSKSQHHTRPMDTFVPVTITVCW